jgi:hypothetical protein
MKIKKKSLISNFTKNSFYIFILFLNKSRVFFLIFQIQSTGTKLGK